MDSSATLTNRMLPSRSPETIDARVVLAGGRAAWVGVMMIVVGAAHAQVPQLRGVAATPIQGGITATDASPVDIPQTNLTPVGPNVGVPGVGVPAANLGVPGSAFANPYPTAPGPVGVPSAIGAPGTFGVPGPIGAPGGIGFQPTPGGATVYGAPQVVPPPPQTGFFNRLLSTPASAPMTPGYGATPPGYGATTLGPTGAPVYDAPPIYNTPPIYPGSPPTAFGAPNAGFGGMGLGGTGTIYGTPPNAYPNSIYPATSPTSLFPNGLNNNGSFLQSGYGYGVRAFRLFQGPRFQYTYVSGSNGANGLGVNDFDVALAFAVPRIFNSSQPLYIIPSFSLHLWDGPSGAISADLPSKAYSAFLDFGWISDPAQMFGTEFGMRVGMFSDFDTGNSDSVRVMGKALVQFRVTPTSTLKGGVYYADRNNVKLVPAFGIICRPNPYTRWDLFFPQPKFTKYCRTLGTYDLWWYMAGDYGGGSWTIQRTDKTDDSVDINELRAVLGLEWGVSNAILVGRRTAFAEIGYAFNREVKYRQNPLDDFDANDAFLFSVGFGY